MQWWYRFKNHKAVVFALWIAGAIIAIGTFLGAINSIVEFVGLGWFNDADGRIASTYRKLTDWLAVEVSLPLWLLLPVSALALVTVVRFAQLKLKQSSPPPVTPTLNTNQQRVLQAISDEIEKQRGFPCFADLRKVTAFSHLVTEGALDVLEERGFMRWIWDHLHVKRAHLTPAGRDYLLSPEVSSE